MLFLLPHTTALAAARDRLATPTGWQEILTSVLHHETYCLRFLRTRPIYCHGRPQLALELSRLPRAGAPAARIARGAGCQRLAVEQMQREAWLFH